MPVHILGIHSGHICSKFKSVSVTVEILGDTTVISGDLSMGLAVNLAERLGAGLVRASLRTFPDGESKITLDEEPQGGIIVVHSLCPPVDSNLIRSLLMIAKAREFTSDVTAVIPYMGYARQDREFLAGEVVTIQVIAQLFGAVGASRLITVDIHSKTALSQFKMEIQNVTAMPALARRFAGTSLKDPIVISPDAGGAARAKRFAELCECDCMALEKRRDRETGSVSILPLSPDAVSGRDAILVDDMISTGGSMAEAARLLRESGCGKIFAVCTHALLVGDARRKIMEAGVSGVISANTVPGPDATVDVSEAILDEIMRQRDQPV